MFPKYAIPREFPITEKGEFEKFVRNLRKLSNNGQAVFLDRDGTIKF